MPSDSRAASAREHHRLAAEDEERAASHRFQRDLLIIALRRDDPARWTYKALADAVGCSPELAAHVCKRGRQPVNVRDPEGRL